MFESLRVAFHRYESDPDTRVAILSGNGPGHFVQAMITTNAGRWQ